MFKETAQNLQCLGFCNSVFYIFCEDLKFTPDSLKTVFHSNRMIADTKV